VPSFSATTVAGGKVHKPIAGDVPTLTVSDEGVMLTRAPREHVTVRYADAAALLRWNDGKRSLIGGDGFTIVLDPAQWKNGPAVVSTVTARVPGELVLPLDRPGPATAQPQAAGQPGSAGQPAGPTRRDRLVRIVTGRRFLLACLVVVLLGSLAGWALSGSQRSNGFPLTLVAALVVGRLIAQGRRRRRRR
jgi:hypothetical protein